MSQSGADYLFYVALDLLVDQVFPVLEEMEELADQTEDALLDASGSIDMGGLHRLRRDASVLRRVLWNQSLVPDQFLRLEHNRLDPQTRPYLQDVRDHAQRGLARAEQVRDDCIALFDLHRSLANDRLNEVLRVLTVISTVFMPLTFIVGVYGMNFDPHAGRWNMPELAWKYGYPAVWALMLAVAVGMWGLFRRRGWIGRGGKSE
jgi:magnesium transporter